MRKNKLKAHGKSLKRQRVKRRLRQLSKFCDTFVLGEFGMLRCKVMKIFGRTCHANSRYLKRRKALLKLINRL